jgi:aspartate racemase
MTRHIGIVACSAEGAALCYRTIAIEGAHVMGEHDHPRVTMSSIPLERYMERIRRDDWPGVAALMLESARDVARAGADFAICPDNTLHQALDLVLPESPIPWLHIADVVAEEARQRGFGRVGILGTKYLMEGPVYPAALQKRDIAWSIPSPADRETINRTIFGELVNAVFTDEARAMFDRVMASLAADGCDAAALACTEIPLIVRPETAPLPTLDSTRLLARAAVRRALEMEVSGLLAPDSGKCENPGGLERSCSMSLLGVGDKAPDFNATDQDGEKASLKDFRGRKVVLYFYPKDDTPGCTTEACSFRDGFSKFRRQKIEVLGVSVDDEKSHKRFADKFDLPFRLLADTDKKIVQDYGVWGEKSMYGRKYMGINRVTYLIDEKGKIAGVWPRVKPDGHADEILAAVQSA